MHWHWRGCPCRVAEEISVITYCCTAKYAALFACRTCAYGLAKLGRPRSLKSLHGTIYRKSLSGFYWWGQRRHDFYHWRQRHFCPVVCTRNWRLSHRCAQHQYPTFSYRLVHWPTQAKNLWKHPNSFAAHTQTVCLWHTWLHQIWSPYRFCSLGVRRFYGLGSKRQSTHALQTFATTIWGGYASNSRGDPKLSVLPHQQN